MSDKCQQLISRRSSLLLALAMGASSLLVACGSSSSVAAAPPLDPFALPARDEVNVRLGYFPNVTHAPALVGIERGLFARELGTVGGSVEPMVFNAGPDAVETLLSGGLDMTYIGPNPAVNAFARSGGEAVRVVAGSTSGGASLVVGQDVMKPEDLRGREVASPQLGGTQDVALRDWLGKQGLRTDRVGGGDVSVVPQTNSDSLTALRSGQIAGAWVPAPWDTRLVEEAGGKVLVDEADLWPDGRFATTLLLVRTDFLASHPSAVNAVLKAHLAAMAVIQAEPDSAQGAANDVIASVTARRLPDDLIREAWGGLTFTADPIAASVVQSADRAVALDLGRAIDLQPLFELGLVNRLLRDAGQPEVTGP